MIYDLIEVTPKKLNIKKVIICIIILVLILGTIVYCVWKSEIIKISKKMELEQKVIAKQEKLEHKVEFEKTVVIKQTQNIIEQIHSIYDVQEKTVFLTFDDGPSRTVTPLILDLLKQENIKATFFELGSRIELNPDLTKRAYEEGHYIANHGYSHIYKNIYQSPQTVLDEYNATEQAIRNALGKQDYNSYLFRFPGGSNGGSHNTLKQDAKGLLEQNGVAYLDWNSLSGDAEGKNTIEDLYKYAVDTIGDKNSVVILMHDASDKILTYEMLPQLITYLREKGYEFKNMYDLIQ